LKSTLIALFATEGNAMQAKLSAGEFSFLLQALEAQSVIGVNNSRLLPSTVTERTAIFETGKRELMEDGWLIQEGRKLDANDQLMLLAAVTVDPEVVIELTRYTVGGNEQKIFYYLATELIVEQFYSEDGHYILSQLDGVSAIGLRLRRAFQIQDELATPGLALSLNRATFESSLNCAKKGDFAALAHLIREQVRQVTIDPVQIAADLSTLRPVGAITFAALLRGKPIAAYEMVLLQSIGAGSWMMSSQEESSMIELLRFDDNLFAEFLRKQIDHVAAVRQSLAETVLHDSY
jgi:hypothetical protein